MYNFPLLTSNSFPIHPALHFPHLIPSVVAIKTCSHFFGSSSDIRSNLLSFQKSPALVWNCALNTFFANDSSSHGGNGGKTLSMFIFFFSLLYSFQPV